MWGTKVRFIDTDRGWGLDEAGNLRMTSNGGDSWTLVDDGIFRELYILDKHHGWVISETGVYRIH